MTLRQVIGEGTYGCAHYPSLICKGDVMSPSDRISKLMSSRHANDEMKEYVIIAGIDPENEFYLGKPDYCDLGDNDENIKAIRKCHIKNKVLKNIDEYALLIMKNGGLDLDKFANTLKSLDNTAINRMKMVNFWIEAHRLLRGIKVFLENDLVHHDLKGGNIVYNEKDNRLNFIDFGLMTSKSKLKTACIKSTNWLSSFHWSFPLELGFENRKPYFAFARRTKEEKTKFVQSLLMDVQKTEPELKISNAIKIFYSHIIPKKTSPLHKHMKTFEDFFTDYSTTILEQITPDDEKYLEFLEKSVNTIDTYGVGLALMGVLRNSSHLIDDKLASALNELFSYMYHPNVFSRYTIDEILTRYEECLDKFGLLSKIDKHFTNHKLVKGYNIPKIISNKLKNINEDMIILSKVELSKHAVSPIKVCSKGSVYNKLTKRCAKTQKQKAITRKSKSSPKKCPVGKELNQKTNRCINICKSGYKRDNNFKCKKIKI